MILLYIDPGTGSMLFSILIGVAAAAIYFLRGLVIKIKFRLSGGNVKAENDRYPIVIFSDSKRYWNVFEPICDELEKREMSAEYWTCSDDDPSLQKNYRTVNCVFIGEGNKAFAKLNMVKADIVLSTTPGLDVYQWKRSRDAKYYVHILHAPSDVTMYRMFGIDFYDALLLSGSYQVAQVRELEALRELPEKETEIVGLTYLDTMKERLDRSDPIQKRETTTVLLAPSWGSSAIFSRFGGKIIDAIIKTGCHLIIRPHPQSYTSEKELIESLMREYPNGEMIEWNRDNDNFEVLRRSDILISDFSGVIFDFSLVFDKPVIYADVSYDKAPYDAFWLKEELWTFTTLPLIGRQLNGDEMEHIEEIIEDCLNNPRYAAGRERARMETWNHMGHSAERTVDYLQKKLEQLSDAGNETE